MATPSTDEREQQEVFRELLESLRTSLPGVQMLFAFLLIVPFNSTFGEVVRTARGAYVIAFVAAALASILLIAPSIQQRIQWAQRETYGQRESEVRHAIKLTVAGSVCLLVAFGAVGYMVGAVVLGSLAGALAGAGFVVIAGWIWFGIPLLMID